MVKNVKGGSGHKKFGRKFTTEKSNNKLRISEEEGEIYAIVTKLLGNNMFQCDCIDGIKRLGHIRGKFCSRGKRDNTLTSGTWVLIGLREWDINESSSIDKKKTKLQQCDLLEVYTESDKIRLKDMVDENWSILISNDVSKKDNNNNNNNGNNEFEFATDRDIEREKILEEMKKNTNKIKMKTEEIEEETEAEINIDDI